MLLSVESKSMSNVTQMMIFFILHISLFEMLFQYLRKNSAIFLRVPPHKHVQFVLRIISSLHAAIVTCSSLYILCTNKELGQNKLIYSSFEISFTLNLTVGYMAYDILIMYLHRSEFDLFSLVHHLVAIVSFYSC
jgi:hypothetical protein